MELSTLKKLMIRQPINYRSIADMNADILAGIHKLPRPVDLVVGVPRSGMLAASILALHLNCALTDVDALLAGRMYAKGQSRDKDYKTIASVDQAETIIVIDDSVYEGNEMRTVRERLGTFTLGKQVI